MALDPISAVGASTTFVNFVGRIRLHLRDFTALNRLTDGVETSDRAIAHAVLLMLDDFAGTPPPLGFFTLETLIDTHYFTAACLKGTIAIILESVLALMVRNDLSFSDGGLTVDMQSVMAGVRQQIQYYKQDWELLKSRKKEQLNIEGMQGVSSPGSEYALLNAWIGETVA